jgi:dephospho-CoA kinase
MPDRQQKKIILLVGPKGAGKTYLATRLEREAGVPFVRVEPIWMSLAAEGRRKGTAFDEEGQRRVIAEVERRLAGSSFLVLESTGVAPWFEAFLARLKNLGRVALIRVCADPSLCLERVRKRDQWQHIEVSDARVVEINAVAEQVTLPWAAEIENRTKEDADEFITKFKLGRVV